VRFGDRGRFEVGDVNTYALRDPGTYDLVFVRGVLHHLDDAAAGRVFALGHAALRPGGRLLTCDPCRHAGQGRLARWLVERDRGAHVRDVEAYRRLACGVFAQVAAEVCRHLLRVPYAHCLMCCEKNTAPVDGAPANRNDNEGRR